MPQDYTQLDTGEKVSAGTTGLNQVMTEYNESQDVIRIKKLRWVSQLVLYNNLQRADQTIASTTLFSFFNRVFSNLYSDVLNSIFIPSEDSDYKKTEVLNKLRQNDFQEMEFWILNYDWTWDACFFGEGYVETIRFDKTEKIMKPVVVNPLYFGHDPFMDDPKEWRYYWKWKTMSALELRRLQGKGVIKKDFDITRISPGLEDEIWDYKNQRDAARLGVNVTNDSLSQNNIYQILEHFTVSDGNFRDNDDYLIPKGVRIIVWTDKNFSQEIRVERLSKYVQENEPWPIVRKQIFREPHSSLSISVPDIVEDKHRAKSVLMNLMFMAAKDDANPIYLYNPDLVQDPTALFSRQILQHIAVDDLDKSVKPLATRPAMSAAVNAFIQLLSSESSEAIGTAIVQPTAQKGKKSATESAMMQQIADLTSSLQAKVIAIGEKEFWSQWYLRLVHNMGEADQKVIKLTSVTGITFETIKIDDFKTKYPPKILMTSQKEAEYKELVLRRDLMQNLPVIMKTLDPKGMANFMKYEYLPKFIKNSQMIDLIVPSSIDQIKARQENEMLDQDKFVPVDPQDDDEVHMYEHAMAKNTASKWAHYFIHEKHRSVKLKMKEDQEKMAASKGQGDQGGQGGAQQPPSPSNPPQKKQVPQVPVNADKQNQAKAAVPLAKEQTNNMQTTGGPLA